MKFEPAHDLLRRHLQRLDVFFRPQTVAVIGATEKAGSVGRTVLWNLVSNPFGGGVFPVNPKRASVLGIKAYPSIADVPAKVDLAVIVTPAPLVPAIVGECVDAGVKGAVVISAGFKECGPAGADLEKTILAQARRGNMRLIGPNCLGVMSPLSGLNATFAGGMAHPGHVGFISQSGALCTAILDWSLKELVGFSAFVSIGSMLDVNWGDLIDYLGEDPHTQSIVIYMESIGDARSFLSAAREVALRKPIIVIKAGRTEQAAKAAASHTGSLAGSNDVLDAAFRRCGVLSVGSIAELFYMAEVLSKQPRPKGPKLTILTNAGGPGVLATDALILSGGELAPLSAEAMSGLDELLPPHWSHNNPIDILGDAGPERYAKAVEIAAKNKESDGLLVILTPQAMTDPTQTAERLKPYARTGKPILASWMGGVDVAAGEAVLNRAGIPTFPYPDTAASAFHYMWKYSYHLRGLYETPAQGDDPGLGSRRLAVAEGLIGKARASGRTLLTELESKQLLAAYGIPTVDTRLATSAAEAASFAAAIGYPVVLKIHSETITHKTDVGGVKLNLIDAESVQAAYAAIEKSAREKAAPGGFLGVTVQKMVAGHDACELILGSSADPQFGPVLLFGAGGVMVEVFKDRALALPPLNTTLALRMMEQTRIFEALKGVRGRKPVDLGALEQLLVRFSELVVEQRTIREIDINPLLASADALIALDARIVLHPPEMKMEDLPRTAIRPYPMKYVQPWTMRDGAEVTIRPIRPEDEPLMAQFHGTLSEQTVYLRYFQNMNLGQRIAHERLTRICFIDYDREMALVADLLNSEPGQHEIIGVGRLIKLHGTSEAECALVVSDKHHGKGLGTELMRRLQSIAADEKLTNLTADILPDNHQMQRLCQKLGFRLRYVAEDQLMKADYTPT